MMQESHMRRKDQARAQKEADKNLAKTDCKIKAAAFDMEKVLHHYYQYYSIITVLQYQYYTES